MVNMEGNNTLTQEKKDQIETEGLVGVQKNTYSSTNGSVLESDISAFYNQKSGQFKRNLVKDTLEDNVDSAVDQALGNKKYASGVGNPNDYVYQRTMEFPQPSIIGIGLVTAAGAKDTSTYFFGQNWTVTRNSAGNYTVTHNIGEKKYLPIVGSVASSVLTARLNTFTNNDFNVLSFNTAGTPTDCAFWFVVFMIP